MGFLIKKVILQRDITYGYELFEYPLGKIVDFPYIAGEIASLIPKESMFSEDARRTEFDTPMFNKSNLGKFVVNVGEKGIFYLNLRPGYKLSQIYVEPEDLVIDIFFSHDNSLLYCFYNPTAKETIVITAVSEKDTENYYERVKKNPLNINLRQEFIKKALINTQPIQNSGMYVFRKTGEYIKEKGHVFEVKFNGQNIILPEMYLDGFYYIQEILRNGAGSNGIETSKIYYLIKDFPELNETDIGGINYSNDEDCEAELALDLGIPYSNLDDPAIKDYFRKIKKLVAEVEEAKELGNNEKVQEKMEEILAIRSRMKKDLDLNGKSKKSKTHAERAVHNVQIGFNKIKKMVSDAGYKEFFEFLNNNISIKKSGSRYIQSPEINWILD